MITITHTHAGGTLIDGSRKGDGVYDVLRGLRDNWRYFPSAGRIGIGQSRDRNADAFKIRRAAEALRAAGHEVTVEVDESQRRTFAEAEQERYDRAGARADRHAELAAKRTSEANGRFAAERQILDGIPFGQPVLLGHHSERRHRRDLERAESHLRAGIAASRKAGHHAGRAETAGRYQDHRENIPATLRRIGKLEADERRLMRELDGTPSRGNEAFADEIRPAAGRYRERLESSLADVREQLGYWRQHVAGAEASGVKIWSAADFAKGDYVQMRGSGRWYLVERVNAKSLTVPTGNNVHSLTVVTRANVVHALGPSQWTHKLPYDEVAGRKPATEMAEIVAGAERRKAEMAAS